MMMQKQFDFHVSLQMYNLFLAQMCGAYAFKKVNSVQNEHAEIKLHLCTGLWVWSLEFV